MKLTIEIDEEMLRHLREITQENHDLAIGDCCGYAGMLELAAEDAVKEGKQL